MDGRRRKAACHLRIGGDLKKEMSTELGCIHDKEQRAEN